MITIPERLAPDVEIHHKLADRIGSEVRVCEPGIVRSFNPEAQTVTVQVAVREHVNFNGVLKWESVPLLVDVPIMMQRGGGFVSTFPVKPGDECLVVFGDKCMDAWWQSGGVQNQIHKRRHDLSDGYAILGVWSQPRRVSNYSADTAQLRNEAGDCYVELAGDRVVNMKGDVLNLMFREINMHGESGNASTLGIQADTVNVTGGSAVNIQAEGNTVIESRNFMAHEHKEVVKGGDLTGGVE